MVVTWWLPVMTHHHRLPCTQPATHVTIACPAHKQPHTSPSPALHTPSHTRNHHLPCTHTSAHVTIACRAHTQHHTSASNAQHTPSHTPSHPYSTTATHTITATHITSTLYHSRPHHHSHTPSQPSPTLNYQPANIACMGSKQNNWKGNRYWKPVKRSLLWEPTNNRRLWALTETTDDNERKQKQQTIMCANRNNLGSWVTTEKPTIMRANRNNRRSRVLTETTDDYECQQKQPNPATTQQNFLKLIYIFSNNINYKFIFERKENH